MARSNFVDFEWSLDVLGVDAKGNVITLENITYSEKIELLEYIIGQIGKGKDNGLFSHLIVGQEEETEHKEDE
jgi:hypothetical protein